MSKRNAFFPLHHTCLTGTLCATLLCLHSPLASAQSLSELKSQLKARIQQGESPLSAARDLAMQNNGRLSPEQNELMRAAVASGKSPSELMEAAKAARQTGDNRALAETLGVSPLQLQGSMPSSYGSSSHSSGQNGLGASPLHSWGSR